MSFVLALLSIFFVSSDDTTPVVESVVCGANNFESLALPIAVDRLESSFAFSTNEIGLADTKEETEGEEDGSDVKIARAVLDTPATSPLLASRLARSVSQRTILGFGPMVRSSHLRC